MATAKVPCILLMANSCGHVVSTSGTNTYTTLLAGHALPIPLQLSLSPRPVRWPPHCSSSSVRSKPPVLWIVCHATRLVAFPIVHSVRRIRHTIALLERHRRSPRSPAAPSFDPSPESGNSMDLLRFWTLAE